MLRLVKIFPVIVMRKQIIGLDISNQNAELPVLKFCVVVGSTETLIQCEKKGEVYLAVIWQKSKEILF